MLIATILAAQCTDERVNIVTKDLFKKYKSVQDYTDCNIHELEEDIKSAGLYRNKARNIIACCKVLIDKYDGNVPDTIKSMIEIPGVGRKIANVILCNIYGKPGIIVDTHFKRLSN